MTKSKNDDDTILSLGPLCGASEALGSKFPWTILVDAYGKQLYVALCTCNNIAIQISIPLKSQSTFVGVLILFVACAVIKITP